MKISSLVIASVVLSGIPLVVGQTSPELKHSELKSMVQGLGYEVKDIGETKFEFTIKTTAYNIPLGAEVSPSGKKIWLTAFFGVMDENAKKDSTRLFNMLTKNGSIQPTQIYVSSKGNLMMGRPIDNRGVTPVILKTDIERMIADVESSSSLWDVKK